MKNKLLVSACLMGFQVRYNGSEKAQLAATLSRWQQAGRLVIHCPELAAGLPTPRLPAEILGGTCGGFQHAVIEYARNVLGWQDAGHAETDSEGRMVIAPLSCSLVETSAVVELRANTLIARAYGRESIEEGYHCRYGVSSAFAAELEQGDLRVTGWDEEGEIRAVELVTHPFFVATLFQHERHALDGRPAPLVQAFLRAAAQ